MRTWLNIVIAEGLWGIVNNAGIVGPFGATVLMTIDDYKAVAAVNLYGLIDVTMTFLPLVKMARGRVVNTSSLNGRISVPLFSPYAVSKYGVEAFTDGLRSVLVNSDQNTIQFKLFVFICKTIALN